MTQSPDGFYMIFTGTHKTLDWSSPLLGLRCVLTEQSRRIIKESFLTHNRHYYVRFSFNHQTISRSFIPHFLGERSQYRTQFFSLESRNGGFGVQWGNYLRI
jgi:hypothetical protein